MMRANAGALHAVLLLSHAHYTARIASLSTKGTQASLVSFACFHAGILGIGMLIMRHTYIPNHELCIHARPRITFTQAYHGSKSQGQGTIVVYMVGDIFNIHVRVRLAADAIAADKTIASKVKVNCLCVFCWCERRWCARWQRFEVTGPSLSHQI